jgi:FMN-dependent NADH-azoreductase
MHLLYIQSSPRGPRSVSIAVTDSFLQAYRKACPGLTVDTLNVWQEKLPDIDQYRLLSWNPWQGVFLRLVERLHSSLLC